MAGNKIVEVFNRGNKDFEFTWDSQHYMVPTKGTVHMLEDAAWGGRRKSMFNLSVYDHAADHILGIVGLHDNTPLVHTPGPDDELINRKEIMDNEHLKAPEKIKFTNKIAIEPRPPDDGRTMFGQGETSPIAHEVKVGEA